MPREQLLILIQERYNQNLLAGNNQIFRFLGVPSLHKLPAGDSAGDSAAVHMVGSARRTQLHEQQRRQPAAVVAQQQQQQQQQQVPALWLHKREYEAELAAEDRAWLAKIYRPYNERLFALLGERIEEWTSAS